MNKKVLVVGGSSFIGFYTIRAFLEKGYTVYTTLRNDKYKSYYQSKNVHCIKFDLTVKEDIANLPVEPLDAVVVLSGLLPANVAVSTKETDVNGDYITTNVLGIINLLNYCMRNNIHRLITTTTYADTSKLWSNDYTISEDDKLFFSYKGDHAMYVISKNAASEVCEYYNEEYGMSNAVFRFPPVYGVGPHTQLYENGKIRKSGVALFIDLAQEGKDITVYGEDCYRDIVYVKDVANAFVQACASENTRGVYNIMSGHSVSLYEQACVISEVFSDGQSKVIRDTKIKNNSISYKYSIEKARKDFGYNPDFADFKTMMSDYKNELYCDDTRNFFGLNEE